MGHCLARRTDGHVRRTPTRVHRKCHHIKDLISQNVRDWTDGRSTFSREIFDNTLHDISHSSRWNPAQWRLSTWKECDAGLVRGYLVPSILDKEIDCLEIYPPLRKTSVRKSVRPTLTPMLLSNTHTRTTAPSQLFSQKLRFRWHVETLVHNVGSSKQFMNIIIEVKSGTN